MKSMQMKALSLAVLALAGLGMAGSAFAVCPGTASAWSATSVGGGTSALAIVSPGLAGTGCKMSSALGNNGAAHAQVRDDSPTGETHYRARFLFDPTNLTGSGGTNQAPIFLINSNAVHDNILNMVKFQFLGTGGGTLTSGKRLAIIAACENAASQFKCQTVVPLPVQQGVNRIEIDLVTGASGTGSLRYWLNDDVTATSDGSPDGTIAITGGNAGWVGVETVFLGMTSPSTLYRTNNTDAAAFFDEFDSRRQTFIGN